MIIVVGADDRFALPMAVTLYSALANLEQGRVVSLYWRPNGRMQGGPGIGRPSECATTWTPLPVDESLR